MVDAVKDADSFICLAEAHGVLGHFMAVLGGLEDFQIPSSFLDSLRVHHRAHLLSNLAMTAELFRILELFRESEIECVVVKGPVLSLRAYGEPAVRQYADLDLLLRQKDIPRAAEILVDAGYDSRIPAEAIRGGKIPGEYRFRGQDTKIILELHTERTLRYFPLPLPIEKYFQNKTSMSLDGRPVPALSAEHEFVLISVHGATHFWGRLMWISDVAATVHNHPELDWKHIRQSAAEVGAERMVRVALLLSERLLGVRVPAEMKNDVARDPECSRLVDKIEKWLPYAGSAAPSVAQRAWFRFRIRGNVLSAAAYLTRLSFSTTEDDWATDAESPISPLAGMLRRPFRLARKYRRNPDS
jgi:putative nucleotidyltransferase-like protein